MYYHNADFTYAKMLNLPQWIKRNKFYPSTLWKIQVSLANRPLGGWVGSSDLQQFLIILIKRFSLLITALHMNTAINLGEHNYQLCVYFAVWPINFIMNTIYLPITLISARLTSVYLFRLAINVLVGKIICNNMHIIVFLCQMIYEVFCHVFLCISNKSLRNVYNIFERSFIKAFYLELYVWNL